jgi:CCR4-NOT transcription complex subunit 9
MNLRAGEVLKKYLPNILKDPSQQYIKDDVVKKWHINLL